MHPAIQRPRASHASSTLQTLDLEAAFQPVPLHRAVPLLPREYHSCGRRNEHSSVGERVILTKAARGAVDDPFANFDERASDADQRPTPTFEP